MIVMGFFYNSVQQYYRASSRELKRLDSIARSPVYSHFSESLNGLSTIRAYKAQGRFLEQNADRIDESQKAYYCLQSSNRWLSVRLELLGALVVYLSALLVVLGRERIDPGLAGLCMTNALSVTGWLSWMVRSSTELEMQMNAMERVLEYLAVPTEAPPVIAESRPEERWPAKGAIDLNNLCVKYRHDLVLKGINCHINHGEKIGIVGRTGAGKSTLVISLFRLVEPASGFIKIDGLDIGQIGLEDLRSKLSIIPQDAVLFSGSIRSNLDPFKRHQDIELWQVLDKIGLKKLCEESNEKLDMVVSEGGSNLSAGQKQLIALGRALLRKSRVLILDEATSSVDQQTDAMIQQTVRDEFKDSTVLAIAHRLNTILDSDRVLVLDNGLVAEFDTPSALASKPGGIFASMLAESGSASRHMKRLNSGPSTSPSPPPPPP